MIVRPVLLTCDCCADVFMPPDEWENPQARDQRALAKTQGWHIGRGDDDCGPCWAKHLAHEKQERVETRAMLRERVR